MSKVICDVCGTSYPDTATQCPICGFVCASAKQGSSGEASDKTDVGGYTHVKGGRFSKNNVRKRNGGATPVRRSGKQSNKNGSNRSDSGNKGLIIAAAVLALAIVAVVIFITLRYFVIPENESKQSVPTGKVNTNNSQNVSTEVACSRIYPSKDNVKLNKEKLSETIDITVEPKDCTNQQIKIKSIDKADIVSAEIEGKSVKLTAIGHGTAVVTINCGEVECIISVTCEIDEILTLTEENVLLTFAGQKISIYPDNIKRDEISWRIDAEKVAKVSNGVVEALGEGKAVVTATYKGQTVTCNIEVKFEEPTGNDNDSNNTNNDTQNNTTPDNFDPVVNGTGSVTE